MFRPSRVRPSAAALVLSVCVSPSAQARIELISKLPPRYISDTGRPRARRRRSAPMGAMSPLSARRRTSSPDRPTGTPVRTSSSSTGSRRKRSW